MQQPTDVINEFQTHGYDLVVIGSSAGGIEALSILVAGLPKDFGAAVVIAQHLDPEHISHLGEILARRSALPVRSVQSQENLLPGVIYVIPADRDVEITDHEVSLKSHGDYRSTPSVNRLFSSAARAHGERLIGVILTGTGSDGASGAYDVKSAGGMVIIENPATAAFPSMPRALAPSTVDLEVDLAQIGPLLGELVTGSYRPTPIEANDTLPVLLHDVREHTGIDFAPYKLPTILRRLQRRLAVSHSENLEGYMRYLAAHPEEYHLLSASFLIKVTEFFRDPDFFAFLRDEILPSLLAEARKASRPARFWSAGCSTGEEAYSLAILIAEALGNDLTAAAPRIFATDVDGAAIEFARRGLYPASALAAMSANMVQRWFTPVDGGYETVPAIRNMITFGQHDLGARAPFPNIDMVLCRNVLIYFTSELQRRALQLFAFALRDAGVLGLGKSESPAPYAAYFEPLSMPLKIYRRQGQRVVAPPPRLTNQPLFVAPPTIRRPLSAVAPTVPPPQGSTTASEYVGAMLLNSKVGVVVVDRHYDIQAINRTAQQLLGIFRAALNEDLIHLVSAPITTPLRAAIDAAFARRGLLEDTIITLSESEPRSLRISVTVSPGDIVNLTPDTVLLQVTDVTALTQAHQAAEAALRRTQLSETTAAPEHATSPSQRRHAWEAERQRLRAEIARMATQLEEIHGINVALRNANDEYVAVNLSVVGLNEDLVVRNEELQASTEEIKTLNEELQATNEELETLNEEMESSVEELRATNEDLNARTREVERLLAAREAQALLSEAKASELTAILRAMSDALLVVNQAGEVILTNATYDQRYGPSRLDWTADDEAGKPLPAAAMPQQRLLEGKPFQLVFTQIPLTGERQWFEAIGEPILLGGAITGAVLTIRDITDRSLLRLQDEFLSLASHELNTPVTSIQAAAQLMRRKLPATEQYLADRLLTILRQCKNLEMLIKDLKDVSRLRYGKVHLRLEPIELTALVQQTIQEFTLVAPQPPIALEVEAAAEGALLVKGDPLRLGQVLYNLLSNARKYAPESPQVIVRLRRVADEAIVEVVDSGPGIAAQHLPHLFDRYYQVNPGNDYSRSGLGLGLFITREFVHAQVGQIAVSSREGVGTTFTLRFPLLALAPSNSPPHTDERAAE